MSRLFLALPLFAAAAAAYLPDGPPSVHAAHKAKMSPAEEAAAGAILADKGLKVEVWAAEPLLANPVAFGFDEHGRCFVVETFRHTHGVPDTRGKPWLDDDLACRTVADRVAMYKKFKFGQYPENSERLKLLWDSNGDGKADMDSVFATGFNRYEDGLAAGVLARKGDVYFTCIPDLYVLKDTNGDNKADVKKSLASGFGVHVQYIGHDLHGLILGPDGKLYFSVGDRGFNLTTKEGKKLFNPDSGAVLRCDLDGSNLEVIHKGLRNPQELAFDDYGNLFTWDNNSDSGDRARWVHIVEGGDSGWRCGFQYGSGYHPPSVPQGNRGPWNTEKLWLPQWDGQAAYIVPPLLNFGNGPAGIVHYPGVGLNEKYKDHFFCADFTGGPGGNSAIWTLSVKPKGASFAVSEPQKLVRQMLPTDVAFGPDGAFYWSDWTSGWEKPNKGRIFRVTDPEAMKNPAVAEARKLIAEGFAKKSIEELAKLLEHPHQQVRQEAQFELASRVPNVGGKEDQLIALLVKLAKSSPSRLARLHSVWTLGMRWASIRTTAHEAMVELLRDKDAEIRRVAAGLLGDHVSRGTQLGAELQRSMARDPLRDLIATDPDARVRAVAAIAYGKIGPAIGIVTPGGGQDYYTPFFELLKTNNDKDPCLRHAGVMGLVHAVRNPVDLWNAWRLAQNKYDLAPVRMGVLLALRKLESDRVAEFLADDDPRIVSEAARAVYDDRIMNSFPALAKLADSPAQPDAVSFRALAANLWLGTPEAATRMARFAGRAGEPDYARAFSLKLLGDWPKPGRRDPVTGITMVLGKRDSSTSVEALKAVGIGIFAGSDVVRREAAQVAAKLNIKEFGPALAGIVKDAKQPPSLRVDALHAIDALRDPAAKNLAVFVLESEHSKLRAAGRAVRARLEPAVMLQELPALLDDEAVSFVEKQGAFAILAAQRSSPEADRLLDRWLDRALANEIPLEILLDLLDAAETRASTPRLRLFAPLKEKTDRYRAQQKVRSDDQLAAYRESLAGGDSERGRDLVLNNSSVYCQRCHKLDGQGGEVGPALNGLAADKEKDRRYMLESIVLPSAKIAKGFDTVILVLHDERTVSGIIKGENKKEIKLVTAENKEITVAVDDVASRRTGPSAMPADLHEKLSRRELRDVVEFLASLREPSKK